ncbi:hypothetical protein LR48_Vigan07g151700 [Vigna angularis]|uniref:Ubiquitin-like protease family profile domain-containing protein n=1 Tax=Phaseolus angularis TaxID=3914 RepID=A0A0L9UYF4_PHAAN|nr:hypothetical protein LR48_Vigan07g151700 [Vigna angularis]
MNIGVGHGGGPTSKIFYYPNHKLAGIYAHYSSSSSSRFLSTVYIFQCNKQLDSWECGYYVMSWIKTIIRASITDDWVEHFKSSSPILQEAIKKIRQELAAYLLQRWT